jgi:hypothetical protein
MTRRRGLRDSSTAALSLDSDTGWAASAPRPDMALPNLNALWGPNSGRTVQDRSLLRVYLDLPASDEAMVHLSTQMNSVASVDPPSVTQVQAWLDEIVTLEETGADEVDSGIAHLGNATSYEGLAPGKTLTRDEKLSQAKTLQWDTSLDKVKYEFGSNPRATAQGQREERISTLTRRIAMALNLRVSSAGGMGGGVLIRG